MSLLLIVETNAFFLGDDPCPGVVLLGGEGGLSPIDLAGPNLDISLKVDLELDQRLWIDRFLDRFSNGIDCTYC